MIITKFETWWVERGRCLFDEKRQAVPKWAGMSSPSN